MVKVMVKVLFRPRAPMTTGPERSSTRTARRLRERRAVRCVMVSGS